MGKRATKLDKQFRIAEFVRMISHGHVNSQLVQFAAEEWGLSERRAHEYIKEAREVIVADINQDRKQVVAELMHGAKTVWEKALADKQYNNALGAMNLLTRLGGLEPNK